jgi:serine/threonine-protein kinase
VGTLLDGKYRIDSFINAGGMGSLYRALHVMLDKTVAVKVIKSELVTSDEVVARFQREARAASNLHHPNIVSVYDLGQTPQGTLYIAMEFIDGSSLKEVLRRNGPLTPRESIDILRQVASALSSAHRKQIVHRDLKSDNLMLASEDGQRVVKLVDFGIAKTFDDSTQLTAAGYMLGTPSYMSPEQAAGRPVDHRTDLYSLGVILYEMLTGKVPFGDTTLTSLLVRLATEVPPPPSARRPDGNVPPALDAVAMRCLEKDPERRFQSASEFAEALERAAAEIEGQPSISDTSVPTLAATLIRPSDTRATGASQVATVPAESAQHVPAPQPRAGLSIGALTVRIAAGVLVLAGVAAAIVYGLRPSNNTPQQETRVSATISQPITPSVPEPTPAAPAAPVPAQTPGAPQPSVAASPAPVSAPAPIDSGRARAASPSAGASRPPAPNTGPSSVGVTPPPSQATIDRTPRTPAPVTAPAPAPVTTVPAQPARSAPSASVMCEGAADVCGAIRSEIVQALQSNQVASDIEITVKVTQVSQTQTTSQLGTPSIVQTYSVEVTGASRGAAVAMPARRIITFDTVFGRATLQKNAQQLAAETLEAVRAFTKGKN